MKNIIDHFMYFSFLLISLFIIYSLQRQNLIYFYYTKLTTNYPKQPK